jgi:hypothetical protein
MLGERLGYQEPIKWVAVQKRKVLYRQGVVYGDWQ